MNADCAEITHTIIMIDVYLKAAVLVSILTSKTRNANNVINCVRSVMARYLKIV